MDTRNIITSADVMYNSHDNRVVATSRLHGRSAVGASRSDAMLNLTAAIKMLAADQDDGIQD